MNLQIPNLWVLLKDPIELEIKLSVFADFFVRILWGVKQKITRLLTAKEKGSIYFVFSSAFQLSTNFFFAFQHFLHWIVRHCEMEISDYIESKWKNSKLRIFIGDSPEGISFIDLWICGFMLRSYDGRLKFQFSCLFWIEETFFIEFSIDIFEAFILKYWKI